MASTGKKYTFTGVRGTGRRKEACARVRIKPGTGLILINGLDPMLYLGNRAGLVMRMKQPLVAAGVEARYDVLIKAQGGGKSGQADAARMGLARALASTNPEFEDIMRKAHLLTRDPRAKERKKYGLRGARKACQFSKR